MIDVAFSSITSRYGGVLHATVLFLTPRRRIPSAHLHPKTHTDVPAMGSPLDAQQARANAHEGGVAQCCAIARREALSSR